MSVGLYGQPCAPAEAGAPWNGDPWGDPHPSMPRQLLQLRVGPGAAADSRGACEEQSSWVALVPPGFITKKILASRLAPRFLRFTHTHDCLILCFNRRHKLHFCTRSRLGPAGRPAAHKMESSRDCTSQRALRHGAAILAPRLHFPGGAAAGEAMSAILPLPPPPVRWIE